MTNSQQISVEIEERMLNFSVEIIQLTKRLPKSVQNEIIASQLIRSSSSIGANFTEANNASSKSDFRNKIFIAKKEASETRYWLRLLKATNPELRTNLADECTEFIFILQKTISSLKAGR